MTTIWVHFALAATFIGALGAMSCAGSAGEALALEEDEKSIGTLSVPLVTTGQAVYRLRAAIFDIATPSGSTQQSLDSEVDPNATELTTDLSVGRYTIALRNGWSLEQLEDDGGASAVNAALITVNPSSVEIRSGGVTELVYTFATADGTIALGKGSLSISVDVVKPASLPSCVLFSGYYYSSSCPSGQTCLLADDTGRTFCAEPGVLPVGAACTSDQCVAGAQCLNVDATQPENRTCTRFCSTQQAEFGCNCLPLGFDGDSGFCGAPPLRSCDLLEQTGCLGGEVCQYGGGAFATCGIPGTLLAGESCMTEVCAPGLDCYGNDELNGYPGRCVAFCDTRRDPYGQCVSDSGGRGYCYPGETGYAGRCLN